MTIPKNDIIFDIMDGKNAYGIDLDGDGKISSDEKALLATRFISPYAETIIFFAGSGERDSAQQASDYIKDIESFKDKNIICVAIPNVYNDAHGRDWLDPVNVTVAYLDQLCSEGKISSANIQIAGFSYGGSGATYLADALQGIQNSSGSTYDVDLTLLDGVMEVVPSYVEDLLDRGVDIGIYSSSGAGTNI